MTISGEIDLYTAPRLHSELGAVLADGMPTRVVIDMSGVEFCDSTGMNVLLSCLRRVRVYRSAAAQRARRGPG